jgi:hypothetical protein
MGRGQGRVGGRPLLSHPVPHDPVYEKQSVLHLAVFLWGGRCWRCTRHSGGGLGLNIFTRRLQQQVTHKKKLAHPSEQIAHPVSSRGNPHARSSALLPLSNHYFTLGPFSWMSMFGSEPSETFKGNSTGVFLSFTTLGPSG